MNSPALRHHLTGLALLIFVFTGIYYVLALLNAFSLASLLALALLVYLGTALSQARRMTAPPRFPLVRDSPAQLGLPAYEEVDFASRDGIDLSGWYIPSQNRGAVALVHTHGANRVQTRHYARALVDAGYGILLFDLRGHARSAGSLCTPGWVEHQDLLGAVDFLRRREEIDQHRIGVIGIGTGAQAAVRAAAQSDSIAALWLDGPLPAVYGDHLPGADTLRQTLYAPWRKLSYALQGWITGSKPPAPLGEVIPAVSPRPVFVAVSGTARQAALARHIHERAGEPRHFWHLDDVPFGTGILEWGDDYDLKLIGFFNRNL
jgi:pimeloyl-ACP methyl ester carboxylesterase